MPSINAAASTADYSHTLAKTLLDDPSHANIPGSVKYRLYPTTQMLRKSTINRKWDQTDSSFGS